MSEGFINNSCSSEYFFEYKIDKVSGDDDIMPPKVYFERDYSKDTLPYTLFVVPQEWLGVRENERNSALPYDRVKIVFDVAGFDCRPLTDTRSQVYKQAECHNSKAGNSIHEFYRDQCRIELEGSNMKDFSGVGVINMIHGTRLAAQFFLTVNFAFKKKIHYKMKRVGNKLNIEFKCKDRPQNIAISLVSNYDRVPCLKNDMGNKIEDYVLDFASGDKYKVVYDLGDYDASTIFTLTMTDDEQTQFYVLHCDENNTINIDTRVPKLPIVRYSCPYCHEPISNKLMDSKRYKKGGIACDSAATNVPTIYASRDGNSKVKRCLYCKDDLVKKDSTLTFDIMGGFARLLPEDFMEHDHFKIAFVGSKRAGKTTYISRFFDISGVEKVQMDMTMIKSALKQLDVTINATPIKQLTAIDASKDRHKRKNSYEINPEPWTNTKDEYVQRSINLDPPKYPIATSNDRGTYGKYPFIATVNDDTYISFYDVAGEDSQAKQMIPTLAGGKNGYIGIFCIVNGKKDLKANSAVFNQLRDANLDENSPIAVIVTKFDTLREEFDPGCICMQNDYFNECTKNYKDSYLKHEIDYSSEEIRSYLEKEGLGNDLSQRYKNIKYFGISSFNFMESVQTPEQHEKEEAELRFKCSASRMELPFIWMLNQFGIIK